MSIDDIIALAAGVASRLTGIPEPAANLGLKLAKLAAEQTTDPEVYLQSLIDDIQRRAQEKAREKFG